MTVTLRGAAACGVPFMRVPPLWFGWSHWPPAPVPGTSAPCGPLRRPHRRSPTASCHPAGSPVPACRARFLFAWERGPEASLYRSAAAAKIRVSIYSGFSSARLKHSFSSFSMRTASMDGAAAVGALNRSGIWASRRTRSSTCFTRSSSSIYRLCPHPGFWQCHRGCPWRFVSRFIPAPHTAHTAFSRMGARAGG